MTTPPIGPAATSPARDIGGLHHVGHVVRDMDAAIARYRRLGFVVPPPAYPALPPREGAPPQPFGAGNTHITFPRNFVELATVVDGGGEVGDDATLVPLRAPAEMLPQVTGTIERTVARLASALARFEGLHILVFQTPDADAAAARLSADGVGHSGVNRMQRPVETEHGTRQVPIGHLEIDGDPGATPEGRLAVAEDLPADAQQPVDHPNGAVDLVGSVLCVAAAELPEHERRYATYFRRQARGDGRARSFDLGGSQVDLVADTDLETVLPGERAPALPAFVAYAVTVRDPAATRELLERNGFPVRETGSGDLFVPAAAALGAAVIFRPAR